MKKNSLFTLALTLLPVLSAGAQTLQQGSAVDAACRHRWRA